MYINPNTLALHPGGDELDGVLVLIALLLLRLMF
jgi:hypothetical protein